MHIGAISNSCCRKPHFTSAPERRLDERARYDIPTLEDLYDSEDRIMEHQKELISKQNKLMSQTLRALSIRIMKPSSQTIENLHNKLIVLETNDNA